MNKKQKPSSKNDNISDKDKDGMEGSKDEEQHRLCLPYVKGVSENIETHCRAIPSSKLRLAFKHADTIRSSCQEQGTPARKKGVVYEVPCQDCDQIYIGDRQDSKENNLNSQ